MSLEDLKRHLFKQYGGFADKRIKNIAKGDRFIVDDRSGGDEHYGWFCMMFVRVQRADEVEVALVGQPPTGPTVEHWVKKHKAELNRGSWRVQIEAVLPLEKAPAALNELAAAMREITAPGRRYTVAAYKYVVPRTAGSLDRLAACLAAYNRGEDLL